jgi:hypothetical protein
MHHLITKKIRMKAENPKYEVGQVWKYECRTGAEASRVIILKIDHTEDEEIIHIAVLDLQIHNPKKVDSPITQIGHLPFASSSLEQSTYELESSNQELPDFMEGYQHWKKAFDAGQAGFFTISVKEAVEYVASSLNR